MAVGALGVQQDARAQPQNGRGSTGKKSQRRVPGPPTSLTVEENVAWPLEFLGVRRRDAKERARTVLGRVDVDSSTLPRRPSELSGGEQQRVAMARALVTEPKLLLADEPIGNLDSRTGEAILDLLRALNGERELTVVMVTHNTFAATYGHRTIELRDGRIARETKTRPEPGARVVPLRT